MSARLRGEIGSGLLAALAALCAFTVGTAACGGGDASSPPGTGATGTGATGTGATDGGDAAPTGCEKDTDCGGGKSCCAGECIDTKSDKAHCGACDNDCAKAAFTSGVSCVDGECEISCSVGWGDCDFLPGNGCEVNTTNDPLNCGACDNICLVANAEAGCKGGQCTIQSCKVGFADCNKDPTDGCEVDLSNDPANCQSCGNACTPAPNTEPYCLAGQCVLGACKTGYDDCDGDSNNGCEVDLFSDPLNCAACGKACPSLSHAATTCKAAVCSVGTCDTGYDDCDQSVWSGCESDLAADKNNCSACGNKCPAVNHGYPGCSGGVCVVAGCDPGYADCDGNPTNGCEVNLANDAQNCAACGNKCPPVANGNAVCAGFQCGIGLCGAPYADCFGGTVDGCETNLQTSVDHCATCATICPAIANGSRGCNSGVCGIGSCSPGYGDCNNSAVDGCEAKFASDVNNCGGCGNACPTPANGVAGCVNGACTLASCNAGYSNCNGSVADGCEAATASDPNACGGCGIKCGSGVCSGSKCQCNTNVLIIPDDVTPTPLVAALNGAGYPAQVATKPSYLFDGASPPLTSAAFGAVVVLAGSTGAATTTDMPAAGQSAIVNFVNTLGNGAVFTEWAAFHVSKGRWATLSELVLLTRTNAFTGPVQYTVDAAFAAHPIWAGLPASFQFNSATNVGLTKTATGVTRVAGSPQAIDAVAIRETPTGRVAQVSHAGNYGTNFGWSNANVQKLMANAVGWVARCK